MPGDVRFVLARSSDRRYIGFLILLVAVLAFLIMVLYVRYGSRIVEGDSMMPALHEGDYLLVTRGYDQPSRGDIVSIRIETDSGATTFVKRVVGLPGDSMEIVGDAAYLDGRLEATANVIRDPLNTARLGPFIVPEGTVYVLGDNRPISDDSRFVGAIPLDHVIGKAVAIYAPIYRARFIRNVHDAQS